MTIKELNGCIEKYAREHNLDKANITALFKSELTIGNEYPGYCRNASTAVWNGEYFEYKRYKFGSWFDDKINHFEDDDPEERYDVFVPIKILNKNEQ